MSNIIDSIRLSGVTYTLSAETSGGGITSGEVQTMIDTSISGKVNVSDNEVPPYYKTYKTGYWPESRNPVSYWAAVDAVKCQTNTFGSSNYGQIITIQVKDSDGNAYSGTSRVMSNKSHKTNPSYYLPSGMGDYLDVTFNIPETEWNTYKERYIVYTAKEGYKITYAEDFKGYDGSYNTAANIVAVGSNQIFEGGQSAYVIENAIEPKIETISDSLSAKTDTSAFTAYSASVETALSGKQDTLSAGTGIEISGNVISATGGGGTVSSAITSGDTNAVAGGAVYDKFDEVEQVTAAALNELNEALSGKQDTLSAGTNITISGNVISAEGGGKAIEAGRGISVTTGETADTISFNLPISAGTGTNSIIENNANNIASGDYSHVEGRFTEANGIASHAEGYWSTAATNYSHAEGNGTVASGYYSHTEGNNTVANNQSEHASGQYNVSSSGSSTWGDSGNTLFSVGNGDWSGRHNAFEIRQNGDIYLTSGGTDIKLQDHLGGGGTVDQTIISGSTNAVAGGAVYNKIDEVEQVTAAGLNALNDKITPTVELTQAQYDALTVKDPNTYYIITDAEAGDLTNYYTKSETNTLLGGKADTATTYTKTEVDTALGGKQATLVSGTNIKTINNESILGSGNIDIQGGGGGNIDQSLNSGSTNAVANSAITTAINTVSGAIPTTYISDVVEGHAGTRTYLGKKMNGSNTITWMIGWGDINGTPIAPFGNRKSNSFSLVETSAITTSISSISTDAQVPSAKAVYDNFGGLKLVKLTQAEYNALATKDSSTLYIIVN